MDASMQKELSGHEPVMDPFPGMRHQSILRQMRMRSSAGPAEMPR